MSAASGTQLAILHTMQDHRLVKLDHGHYVLTAKGQLASRIRWSTVSSLLAAGWIKEGKVTKADKAQGILLVYVLTAEGVDVLRNVPMGKGPSKAAVKKLTTIRRNLKRKPKKVTAKV